ncbi:MAG TPA: hypothetical protein VKV15_12895 [Bryobacteraceae bacterium]|nr:hypothetical protein [Bryobacteraceae bacterium]
MEAFEWDLSSDDKRPLPAFLYVHFSKAISRYRDLLHRTKRRGALDYIAWVTRNILELRVWVEYCSQSQQHSEEFFQDAVRDLNDLNRAIGGVDPEDSKTLQKANKFLGNAKPPHKFKDVRDAAEDVELMPRFKQYNKLLSKFVHPNALSVLGRFQYSADQIRKLFVEIGTGIADEAMQKLEVSFLGEAYRKYQPSIDKVTSAQPKGKRPF